MKRSLTLAAFALVALAPIASAEITTLDEALDAVRNHRVGQNQIPQAVGEEAADACFEADTRDLTYLMQVARLGKAEQRLAKVLMERFLEDPQAEAHITFHITKIDRVASTAAARELSDWNSTLLELTADVISPVPAFVNLLAWHGTGDQIKELLASWREPDQLAYPLLGFFLQRLRESSDPLGAFEAILAVELPRRSEQYRFTTAKLLVRQHKAVQSYLVSRLREGDTTPLLFRVLPSLPSKSLPGVRRFLVGRLKKERGMTLAAAVEACTRLGMVEALPYAVSMAESGEDAEKVVALSCVADLLGIAKKSERRDYDAQLERARQAASSAISEGEGELFATGIRVGMTLHLEFDPQDILEWAQDRQLSDEVRITALASLPHHVEGGVETFTLLVKLLDDPIVSECAHRTLMSMANTRLPRRSALWKRWLERYAGNPENPR